MTAEPGSRLKLQASAVRADQIASNAQPQTHTLADTLPLLPAVIWAEDLFLFF
jgi:hypothetical protein